LTLTLKAARVNKGFSQRKAAKGLLINEATLSQYELGKRYPDVQVIKRMEILYGIEYKDINFSPESTI
jgi:transcriptional regulator with XRE-family HTH domain